MNPHSYVRLRRPWEVVIDVAHPGPARLLARLLDETIRNRIPAYGPTSTFRHVIARAHVPRDVVAASIRRWPATALPDLESLRTELDADAILVLERKTCRTVFMFENGHDPVSVAKLPRPGDLSVEREHALLQRLGDIAVAPRPLEKRVLANHGEAFLQEMEPGQPLRLNPTRARDPRSLPWEQRLRSACAGLERLARHTAGSLDAEDMAPADQVLSAADLSPNTRRRLEEALANRGERGVLRHGDTSPQNVLVQGDEMTVLIDWELAREGGAPGFDVLNLAVASFEQTMALRRISPRSIATGFSESWQSAPFWQEARRSAHDAAAAAEAGDSYREHLVTLFFARRFGRRLGGRHHPAARDLARAALEVVCAR